MSGGLPGDVFVFGWSLWLGVSALRSYAEGGWESASEWIPHSLVFVLVAIPSFSVASQNLAAKSPAGLWEPAWIWMPAVLPYWLVFIQAVRILRRLC